MTWTVIEQNKLKKQVSDLNNRIDNLHSSGNSGVISNLEIVPTSVAYNNRFFNPDGNTATENTAIYIRLDYSKGDYVYGLYGEISTAQTQVGGGMTKVIHKGAGDAHYVALEHAGAGFGYEAAMFKDGENGFIATLQGALGFSESVHDQSNCVGFQALWGDDSVNPGFVPNYALFFANNSPGHAFMARRNQYADEGVPQFMITEPSYRGRWYAFGNGSTHLIGAAATSGVPRQNSPDLVLKGLYWDGAASVERNSLFKTVVKSGTDTAQLWAYFGPTGTETLGMIIDASGIDLQGHTLSGVDSITFNISSTGLDLQDSPITGVSGFTMHTSGTGMDLQSNSITGCNGVNGTGVTARLTNFNDADFLGTTLRIQGRRTVTNSNDAGNSGDFCFDTDFIYCCIATNTWKKAALSSW